MKNFLTTFIIIIILHTSLTQIMCMEPMHPKYKPQPLNIVYAPWREDYVNAQQKPKNPLYKPCIFCNIISNKNNAKNLILHRGKHTLIMLASQPYIGNGIHFLIVPYEHKRELCDLSTETYDEENIITQKLCAAFSSDAHTTYINTNQGSAAGASIPEHHHKHIMINHAPHYYNLIHAIQETKKNIDLIALFQKLQPQINQLEHVTLTQKSHNTYNKNCYECSIINGDILENLIIHRGKYATIMLSHYPTYFGEIDIIPHEHIEALETMPMETYKEINTLTTIIYPIILKIVCAQDSNIGLISYGNKATDAEHIKQKIIPRKNTWIKTPITKSNHINGDIKKFYKKLLSEWNSLLNKNYQQQKAKL